MNSSIQWAVNCRAASHRDLLCRTVLLLQLSAAAALVACGGGSLPDAQDTTGTSALPGRLASNGVSVATITTVRPPDQRPSDLFGTRAVLRDNDNTLIVGAPNGGGSVHIFARTAAGAWEQTALLRPTASQPFGSDEYASELAVSGDGSTIAVGARSDLSRGSGIGSDPGDREPPLEQSGAVWVYVKQDGTWQLQEFIKAAQPAVGGAFGYSVALSHDGNWMAVGAGNEGASGAVHLFHRDAAGRWTLADHIKASNAAAGAVFGFVVRLSADGRVLAVGAIGESSADCRIDGNQHDTGQELAGAVYVFERTAQDRMEQRAYIKACDRPGANQFGYAMAMDPAGDLLVVGAPLEDAEVLSCSVPEFPGQTNRVGRAYVFTRSGADWVRSGALVASNAAAGDRFASDVKMSADTSTLAIGAPGEDSGLTGVNPRQDDESVIEAGAIYVFRRGADGTYAQTHYVKPPPLVTREFQVIGDEFFNGLDLSGDGSVLVMGHTLDAGVVHVYDGLF